VFATQRTTRRHIPEDDTLHNHCVSTTKPNRLMLFEETVAVYCEKHMKHTDTLCGQNAEFWYVKAGGTYTNH
jgi:hypothetical protein